VNVHFQAIPRQSQWLPDALLSVNHELARKDVEDAAFMRDDGECSSAFNGTMNVVPGDFGFFERYDPFAVFG
jgi:hypothetical protein